MDKVSLFEELYIQAAERNHEAALSILKDLKPSVDMYLSRGLEHPSTPEGMRNGIFELGELLAAMRPAKGENQLDPNKLRRLVVLLEQRLDNWLVAPKVGVLA